MGLDTSLGRHNHCLWQHLPPTYSSDSVHRPCYECWCTTPSWLSTTSAVAHPDKTSPLLWASSKDMSHAGFLQSPTYVDPRAPQGLEASPRPPTPHLPSDHGSRPPATRPWFEFSMKACRRSRMVEAACGNGYASVWGMPIPWWWWWWWWYLPFPIFTPFPWNLARESVGPLWAPQRGLGRNPSRN